MHEGCSGQFADGKQILEKIRMMGFSGMSVVEPLEISCTGCGSVFEMFTMEAACPNCRMVYAVTPCHSNSAKNVMPAGFEF
jgi:hypothetical protein